MRDFNEPFYEGKQCKCCKPAEASPASIADIAFGTGEIAARLRAVALIEAEVEKLLTPPIMVDREFVDGLEHAADLIKGENK